MDQKQFNLFQTAIQWVLDEERATEKHVKHNNGVIHRQNLWGEGVLTPEEIVLKQRVHYIGEDVVRVVCPTAACVAGNITLIHGDKMVSRCQYRGEMVTVVEHCVDDEKTVHLIKNRAQELTGISNVDAFRLFSAKNSRERVIDLATEIAKNHGYELELV